MDLKLKAPLTGLHQAHLYFPIRQGLIQAIQQLVCLFPGYAQRWGNPERKPSFFHTRAAGPVKRAVKNDSVFKADGLQPEFGLGILSKEIHGFTIFNQLDDHQHAPAPGIGHRGMGQQSIFLRM